MKGACSAKQEEKAGTADLTDLVALNPKKKIPFELVEKIELSHNTRLFRFALQSPRHRLGLPIGQHMFFYAKVRCLRSCDGDSSDCVMTRPGQINYEAVGSEPQVVSLIHALEPCTVAYAFLMAEVIFWLFFYLSSNVFEVAFQMRAGPVYPDIGCCALCRRRVSW